MWIARSFPLGALLMCSWACQGEIDQDLASERPEQTNGTSPPGPSDKDPDSSFCETDTGACGEICTPTDAGLERCGDECVILQSNARHCGSCFDACPADLVCSGGQCTTSCAPGEQRCGQSCVDTQGSDPSHCGSCDNTCTGGRGCSSGSCQCSGGRTWNGSSCECPAEQNWNGSACVADSGSVFDQCRFHFGTIDSFARDNAAIRNQIDFFTPGWMGYQATFDQHYVCNDTAPGAALEGKVPVVVSYVAAFFSKRLGRCDCNVSSCGSSGGRANDLCNFGAADIKQNLSAILAIYRSYAQGYRDCYGTTRPIIFEMEPDWYQYTYSSQTSPLTNAEAANYMKQFVEAIKQYLPNAAFSMDISPWVAPNNGSDHGAQWYGNFDMSLFTFVNTSGGSTEAANTRIRSENNMTWAGVSQATGKPILADTGYGANGVSAGHDGNWDNPSYINARMNDGVVSISQYNPNSNWGSTISSIRSQLVTPKFCP